MFGLTSENDLEVLNKYFKEFILFVQQRENKLNLANPTGNSVLDNILKEWDKEALGMEVRLQEDMRALGEVVLTLDKIEQGMYSCKIKSTSRNPLVKQLTKTVNKMIDATKTNMDHLISTLDSYTADDFTPTVNIDPVLKGEILSVMKSVNHLGSALSLNAKQNLTNLQDTK